MQSLLVCLKKFSVLSIFVIILFVSFNLFAEIEKGKWNFVKDSDYCYIGSIPVETEMPEGKKRGDTYILVYRINKDPNPIVQITAGYKYKEDEPVIVQIDKKDYNFFSEEDTAFTNDDKKIIYAMKMGLKLSVKGLSSRETKTADFYTLDGFTASYKKLTEDC